MANITGDAQLFEDSFVVTEFDQHKYARVARINANSNDNHTAMTLDINTELFPCHIGDALHVTLATSLSLDGSKEEELGWRDVKGESTLADMYDYVCHGKVYKFEDGPDGQTLKAFVSFGGLLMLLEGPFKKLTPVRVDQCYLLIKK